MITLGRELISHINTTVPCPIGSDDVQGGNAVQNLTRAMAARRANVVFVYYRVHDQISMKLKRRRAVVFSLATGPEVTLVSLRPANAEQPTSYASVGDGQVEEQ